MLPKVHRLPRVEDHDPSTMRVGKKEADLVSDGADWDQSSKARTIKAGNTAIPLVLVIMNVYARVPSSAAPGASVSRRHPALYRATRSVLFVLLQKALVGVAFLTNVAVIYTFWGMFNFNEYVGWLCLAMISYSSL